jgi:hypothetical protein
MRILACRNFRVSYPLAHFETFSAALALGFTVTLNQFLRRSLAQVRATMAADHEVRVTNVAATAVPSYATVPVGDLIVDRVGLRRVEIFSSVHMQSHAIRRSSGGRG